MAWVHGSTTYIALNGADLSAYTNDSKLARNADSHDTTTYGKTSKTYSGGLKDATASLSGIYDNTAGTGPRAVIEPLIGTVTELVRRPEGTGAGKPEETVDVLITSYEETNPVADNVMWSCELQCSDDIVTTTQT